MYRRLKFSADRAAVEVSSYPGASRRSDRIAAGVHGPVEAHVVVSELAIEEVGIGSLEAAFGKRLGEHGPKRFRVSRFSLVAE